jgi:xylono-1,5-lactonase
MELMAFEATICVAPTQCVLGEGPIWDAHQQVLWFVDIKSDFIYQFDPRTGDLKSWPTPPSPCFIVPSISGRLLVGLRHGLYYFSPETGSFDLLQPVETDQPENRLNDGHVDAKGRLWFGTMHNLGLEPTGCLYRFDRNGLHVCDTGYVITNGPATSPDGGTLYHTDTMERLIYAFDIANDGAISNKRVFARINKGYPDGPAVDANGNLWTGLYGGWGLNCYRHDGVLQGHVAFPCANVTKLAFGGPDLKTIYATTARQELSTHDLEKQPQAGGLFALSSPVAGLAQGVFDDTSL